MALALIPFLLFSPEAIRPAFAGSFLNGSPEMGEHYSPAENLEKIDIAILKKAKKTIDIAMYAFTDRNLSGVLLEEAGKGIRIRIYRDRTQIHDHGDQSKKLSGKPGIEIRIKRNGRSNIMHLKSYIVDGKILRTGSANWSPPGEGAACRRYSCGHRLQQDNNLFLTTDPKMARQFTKEFDHLWHRPNNMKHLPKETRRRRRYD
ncbi:MAG: phospholipase D-like domain-containing protein [Leptospirillum sp.]